MIIVIFGLPGTGKSFFARHLARETGADYLNTDIIRQEHGKKGRYDEKTRRQVYDLLCREMTRSLSGNPEVIVDGTFQSKETREQFIDRSNDLNEEIRFIEMRAGEDTVKERMKSERAYSEADYEVYLKVKDSFESMDKPHLTLHSDRQDLEAMIKKTKTLMYG